MFFPQLLALSSVQMFTIYVVSVDSHLDLCSFDVGAPLRGVHQDTSFHHGEGHSAGGCGMSQRHRGALAT